jgi:hypothetical protein
MKYAEETSLGTGKYVLIKRRFSVVYFGDDFTQNLGETGNYEKALGKAFNFLASFIEEDDKAILKKVEVNRGYNTGEYITLLTPETESHVDLEYHIEILYKDTIIRYMTKEDFEKLKMIKPKLFDESRQGFCY